MAESSRRSSWRGGDCEGTSTCPRYEALDGTTVTVYALADRPDVEASALVRLAWLAVDHPALDEFEVNPLVATPDGVHAVDFHAALADES